jgi:wyosine [tRNA(Phe)-imidazoG37] synthetase (radical SAM superfamily)
LTITAIVKNTDVLADEFKRVENGQVFQMYFSLKDPKKQEWMQIQIPAPSTDVDEVWENVTADVPFYENFVCSM